MKINMDRLKKNILQVGEIGRKDGEGITRLAFSKEYYEAAKTLVKIMKEANLEVEVDPLGSVIGKKRGIRNDLPSIMIGSHLDTVKNGGLFDGALGIIAGLEAVNYINENNISINHPIEIVAFNGEEGSEMGGTFCSRVMMGLQDPYEPGLEKKLSSYGLTIDDVKKSIRDPKEIGVFLEMHVEQGSNLYDKNISVGIVEGIVGITRYNVKVKGEANHSGTTPMNSRKDPMIGAAKIILEIERIAKEVGQPFVATVGVINASPGAVNVIPESVEFSLELRDLQQKNIDSVVARIKKFAQEIKEIDCEFNLNIKKSSTKLDKKIVEAIRKSCTELNIPYQSMASGAGHDANAMSKKVDTGMIFVQSKYGKSHCPEEWTEWEDVENGMKVLIQTITNIDKR